MPVNIAVLILLLYESVVDIIKRRINIIPAAAVGVLGMIMNGFVYKRPVWWLAGMTAGVMLILAAFISRDRIGYGDGIIFLVLGACVEPSVVLWVLWISMLAAGIMGGILIIGGKRGREKPIPYIPFVASAYMLTCVLRMTAG